MLSYLGGDPGEVVKEDAEDVGLFTVFFPSSDDTVFGLWLGVVSDTWTRRIIVELGEDAAEGPGT